MIKVNAALLRAEAEASWEGMSSRIKTAGFNYYQQLLQRHTKAKKRGENTTADERNGLIKIPFVMLSVDHFIYKSILYTAIKGCAFKRILQRVKNLFFPLKAFP